MTAKELEVANKYDLQPTQARILVALCEFPDYAPHWAVHENDAARKVHVSNIRRKLRPHGLGIASVRGMGYRLEKIA